MPINCSSTYCIKNAVDKQAAETGNDVSFSDFIDNIPQLKRGEIIKGVIVRYDPDFVYVDVKDKSEGKIPMSEFLKTPDFDLDKAIEDHQEIEIYVRSIRNTEMGKEILLSKARVDFNKYKELLKKAYEEKTPVTVKVVSKVKDGVIASYGGADIYIHRTQLELHAVEDLDKYVGQTLEILITAFDDSNSRRLRVTGSRRSLLAAIRDKQAEAIWDNLEVGDVYEGTVRNLTLNQSLDLTILISAPLPSSSLYELGKSCSSFFLLIAKAEPSGSPKFITDLMLMEIRRRSKLTSSTLA